ncbi:MAG: sigma-70 family RNA polymerase sigma factor [Bacteroidales bacterium]|nr:sigma-70 family RNA polymerase sigma factor [Bacteroidales bacterium]
MIDKTTIEQCLKNDKASQKKLYDSLAPKMYAVCLRYASKRVAAEDILQEAFIKVFKYLPTFNFSGSFEGWVRRIVVNTALDHIKKYAEPFEEMNESNTDETLISVNDAIAQLGAQDLFRLIQSLPEGKRLIFNLYAFEGYSHKEIAQLLGISIMTSKGQYSKAKKILQEKIMNLNNVIYEHK